MATGYVIIYSVPVRYETEKAAISHILLCQRQKGGGYYGLFVFNTYYYNSCTYRRDNQELKKITAESHNAAVIFIAIH